MSEFIFDQSAMINGNIFKFEDRLHTKLNRFSNGGTILVTYFSQDDPSITVDRGTRNIDELFGQNSPLRYNEIKNLPINGLTPATPENQEELQVSDISVEGDATILPSTIVPAQMDFFIIDHLKMCALFEVTDVSYDNMKVDGHYKIHYRLHSTAPATIEKLRHQVIQVFHTDMNEVGGTRDAVIREDDFLYREKIQRMMADMLDSYKAMFYDKTHNCFLYQDRKLGLRIFDLCGNHFMAKHGIMNQSNGLQYIALQDKLYEPKLPYYYSQSIYHWLEQHAPASLIQKFSYHLVSSDLYPYSSFALWYDTDVYVMHPLSIPEAKTYKVDPVYTFFQEDQFKALIDHNKKPNNVYEALLWDFIYHDKMGLQDISLHLADFLNAGMDQKEIYLYTPIILYIIQVILGLD